MQDPPALTKAKETPTGAAPPPASPEPEGVRTAPDHDRKGWPPGIPYIIGNEACERFSYYGMRAILQVHLTALFAAAYAEANAERAATQVVHLFFAGVYAFPMIGALVADRWAGKYRTILYLSLVYCAGNAVLALYEGQLWGMYLGLTLIAIGSGGIKPCVSANVGDQFGRSNQHLLRSVYQIFYFSINFGSFFATILIPLMRNYSGAWVKSWFPGTFDHFDDIRLGTSLAFALPGVLMFLATLIFWMGRRQFVHVPPRPGGAIGLIDAACSVSLFLAAGHLFATRELLHGYFGGYTPAYWLSLAAISAFFLAVGLYLFNLRQRLQPDDGFLSITLHVLRSHLTGKRAASGGSHEDHELARSWFWRPAVERFGGAATEGPVAVFKIISVFFLTMFFWSLFDQKASTWVTQAKGMDLRLFGQGRESWLGIPNANLLPSQTQLLNPLLVMLMLPLMNVVYRGFDRLGVATTPLRRMTAGMLITGLSFVAAALLQNRIDAAPDNSVWIGWQFPQYFILTVGEVLVSVTGLEFAYTQAPRKMKSTVMGFWLLFITLGNVLVVILTGINLGKAQFFLLCGGLCGAAALLFGLRAAFYQPKSYAQE
jgi:POT family proton-dependent oligopeptide transporter